MIYFIEPKFFQKVTLFCLLCDVSFVTVASASCYVAGALADVITVAAAAVVRVHVPFFSAASIPRNDCPARRP